MVKAAIFVLAGALFAFDAHAAGTSSPKPPPPPGVDFASLPATAQVRPIAVDGKPHQVMARLLVDKAVVAPGEPFRVGIQLVQDKGWHTYWKSPGDIGLPTDITWTLPSGGTVGPYAYPVPQRFEYEGLVSYGYDDEVLLVADATLSASGTVSAKASWLVCEIQCIPGSAELSLPVTVGPTSSPGPFAPLFDHYAKQQPTALPEGVTIEPVLSVSAVKANEKFRAAFLISGAEVGDALWPTFVPIGSYDWFVDAARVQKLADGRALVLVEGTAYEPDPLPTDARIGGLFQVQVGGAWVRSEVTAPMPWAPSDGAVVASEHPIWGLVATAPEPPAAGGPPATGGPPGGGPAESAASVVPSAAASGSLLGMLAFAFVGGLLLNVMPCVFPVLTLKLFGLVSHADASPLDQKKSGLAYTAGVVVSFWVLAVAVLAAKTTAGGVGWGFQFQSPMYVAALATIVFAFGLSLFGVFEVPALGADAAAGAAASKSGLGGDFLNGVFATLVATPCTAPFLGPAVGFAFGQSGPVVVLFFTVIGLGLAAPFLLVAFVPALFRLMPHPGAWMESFKQLMGFTLMATVIWMVDILAAQVGVDGAIGFLAFLAFVALGAWVFGKWGGVEQTLGRQAGALGVAGVIAGFGGWGFLELDLAPATCDDGAVVHELDWSEGIPWQAFSEERVAALAGKPMLVDFTADWCLTCKVNERTVLESERVVQAMKDEGVFPIKADWTRRDAVISEWLARYGRAGVPFYLVLPADPAAKPIPLGEVLTTDAVVSALEQAARGSVAKN